MKCGAFCHLPCLRLMRNFTNTHPSIPRRLPSCDISLCRWQYFSLLVKGIKIIILPLQFNSDDGGCRGVALRNFFLKHSKKAFRIEWLVTHVKLSFALKAPGDFFLWIPAHSTFTPSPWIKWSERRCFMVFPSTKENFMFDSWTWHPCRIRLLPFSNVFLRCFPIICSKSKEMMKSDCWWIKYKALRKTFFLLTAINSQVRKFRPWKFNT